MTACPAPHASTLPRAPSLRLSTPASESSSNQPSPPLPSHRAPINRVPVLLHPSPFTIHQSRFTSHHLSRVTESPSTESPFFFTIHESRVTLHVLILLPTDLSANFGPGVGQAAAVARTRHGGKSGLHRAGCQVTPGGREPTESAAENIPPKRSRKRTPVRVKRCGKSAPRHW